MPNPDKAERVRQRADILRIADANHDGCRDGHQTALANHHLVDQLTMLVRAVVNMAATLDGTT